MATVTNNNSMNNDDQDQNGVIATGGGQGSLAKGGLAGSPSAAQGPTQQGSGRFTNLSKYVQANQKGAENLSQRVGTGIQNQFNAQEKDTANKNQDLSGNVKTGQGVLAVGSGENKKLGGIADNLQGGFNSILNNDRGAFGTAQQDAQSFVKNNENYNAFKNVQSGAGVDQKALNTQYRGVQGSANDYQSLFDKRQAQVGNSAGRNEALGEFIGGQGQAVRPAYTRGQRGLDNLILGQNAPALQKLIDNVGANSANVANTFKNVGATGNDLEALIKDESSLMGSINNNAKRAQSGFQGAFDDTKVNELNTARQSAYDTDKNELLNGGVSEKLYTKLLQKQSPESLGVTGDGVYTGKYLDTLRANQGDLDTVLKRAQTAGSVDDLVNTDDVATDSALADIFGGGQKFTKAGDQSTGTTVDSAAFLKGVNDSVNANANTGELTQWDDFANQMGRNTITKAVSGETPEQRMARLKKSMNDSFTW